MLFSKKVKTSKGGIKIAASIVAAGVLFSGCSFTMQESMNKDLSEISKNNDRPKELAGVQVPDLSKQFKEKISKRKFISFENPISLNNVLKHLEEMDGKKYFLDRNSENIIFPTSSYKAKNFKEVATYLADTTGQTIYVDPKYALFKNRLQVVKVKDAKAEKYNFAKVPFKLNMNIKVTDALKQLKKNPNFTFSLLIDYEDFEIQKNNRLFEDVYVSYKGTNVKEFFDFIEKKLNIYVDIDYDAKVVRIHKYKKHFFQLIVDNKDITGTIGSEDTGVTKDSEAKESKMQQKVDIGIYDELEKSLDKVIADAKTRKNENAYKSIDYQTGSVEVYADKRTIKEAQQKIEDFNKKYKDMIEVEFINMEIVLTKDYLLKTGLDLTRVGTDVTTNFKTNFNVADALLNLVKKGSGTNTTNFLLQSAQEFGYIANKDAKKWKLRNHIPRSLNEMKTSRYLKNIKIIDPTVDGGNEKSETETDVISEPENYTVEAHYSNGWVTLVFNNAVGKLTDMTSLKAGDTEVSNPQTKSTRGNEDVYLRNGDVYILEDSVSLERSKKYEGILPTEFIALNAIGGGNDEKMVYTQKIKLVTAKRVE